MSVVAVVEFADVFDNRFVLPRGRGRPVCEAGVDPYASPLLAASHKDLAPACRFRLIRPTTKELVNIQK